MRVFGVRSKGPFNPRPHLLPNEFPGSINLQALPYKLTNDYTLRGRGLKEKEEGKERLVG